MTSPSRPFLLVAMLLGLLAALAAWNVSWMLTQRNLAHRTAADLENCRELALEIQTLRQRPALVSEQDLGIQELAQRIELAAATAQLDPAAVEGVFPQPAQRVGDLPYVRKPTLLKLKGVSLAQAATFLYHLAAGSALHIRDLRLLPESAESAADRWTADVTVTYLMDAPARTPSEP
jgi:type II secretory pathway pseudopilin PulG